MATTCTPCSRCGAALGLRPGSTRYCLNCTRRGLSTPVRQRAYAAVARAVRKGDLPHPKSLNCVDCGFPAAHYDHRDYGKPLVVDAVCRNCNHRRGPARGVVWVKAGSKAVGAHANTFGTPASELHPSDRGAA